MRRADNIERLKMILEEHGLGGFETEYRFAPPRRWRFDIAWVDKKVALEYDGGIFIAGRHTRGMGYTRDVEKLNTACVMGWRVLRCTKHTNIETLIEQLKLVIDSCRGEKENGGNK